MRRLSTYFIVLAAALLVAVSCIYDFEPKFEGSDGLLVVDGDILIGAITTVTLDRTEKLNPDSTDIYSLSPMDFYDVYVVSENGTDIKGSRELANDHCPRYHIEIDTRNLDPSVKYRMEIIQTWTGKKYVSPWLQPLKSQKIDSLSWAVNRESERLEIRVSSSGDADGCYFRWTGREVWEFVAPLYAWCYYDSKKRDIFEFENGENTYYCWNRGSVSDVMIADVSEVADARIVNYRLYSYPKETVKISYLYRVELIQECISEEAFRYWKMVERNTQDVGGLFSSQPSEIRGNLVNENDPSEVVIGYISASVVSSRYLYVDNHVTRFGTYRVPVPEATVLNRMDWLRFYNSNYRPFMIHEEELPNGDIKTDPDVYDWYPRRCVDCTASGGIKAKPHDWPNDDI